MYKSRQNRLVKKIFFSISLLFFHTLIFAFEITPLNALSQWIDEASHDITIEYLQNNADSKNFFGQPMIDNLYGKSLKMVETNYLVPMFKSLKLATLSVNESYSCNLTDNDLVNILYFANSEFKKNIKSVSQHLKKPLKADMKDSCKKLYACKGAGSGFTPDSVADCKSEINTIFLDLYSNHSFASNLSDKNLGSDSFRNRSLKDSSYDILYDIYVLSKIFFGEVKPVPEILFYHIPTLSPQNNTSPTNYSMQIDWFSPYNTYIVENVGGVSGENAGTNPGSNASSGTEAPGQVVISGVVDTGIQNFLQVVNYTVNSSDGYEFLGSDCIKGFSISGYLYTGEGHIYISGENNPISPQEHIQNIVQEINNFSCNNDGNCDMWESTDCADCHNSTGNVYIQEILNIVQGLGNNNTLEDPSLSCFAKCLQYNKPEEKLLCLARCTCLSYESPYFDPATTPGLGPIFKLKFCVVPVVDSKVYKKTKVNNLADIISQIYNVVSGLRNSGQLMINKKTREFLDAGFQFNNFAKQLSFSIDGYTKHSHSVQQIAAETNAQKELNANLQESILGFDQNIKDGKNKYIIKGNNAKLGSVNQMESYRGIGVDGGKLVNLLQDEKVLSVDSEIQKFLQSNLDFWMNMKNFLDSFNQTAKVFRAKEKK